MAIATPDNTCFERIVRVGHTAYGSHYCRIRIFDTGDGFKRLSITGVEGPMRNGDARGGCGQCKPRVGEITTYAPGWSPALVRQFVAVWDRWHLNDMNAGTIRQMDIVKEHFDSIGQRYNYSAACRFLAAHRLLNDNGRKYGRVWYRRELPADVIAFLTSLPRTDRMPAWC